MKCCEPRSKANSPKARLTLPAPMASTASPGRTSRSSRSMLSLNVPQLTTFLWPPARKALGPGANQIGGNVEIKSNRGCGGGVVDVVNAGRTGQAKPAQVVAAKGEAELAGQAAQVHIAYDQIRLT